MCEGNQTPNHLVFFFHFAKIHNFVFHHTAKKALPFFVVSYPNASIKLCISDGSPTKNACDAAEKK